MYARFALTMPIASQTQRPKELEIVDRYLGGLTTCLHFDEIALLLVAFAVMLAVVLVAAVPVSAVAIVVSL